LRAIFALCQGWWQRAPPVVCRWPKAPTISTSISRAGPQVRQIIGIVGDIRSEGLDSKPRPIMYAPQARLPDAESVPFFRLLPMAWLVRTQGEPQQLMPVLQDQLRQTTGLPVTDVVPMDQVVWAQTGRQRLNVLLMTVFGSSALLLAAMEFTD
jgi:putative ABC transport system permease protein